MNESYSGPGANRMPGPCVVCGLTYYPLSMGGPHICPSCDCGIEPQDPRHAKNRLALKEGSALNQPILMPASRDALILAALEQVAGDIKAIRQLLETFCAKKP